MIELFLPHPDARLQRNRTTHWRAKQKPKKEAIALAIEETNKLLAKEVRSYELLCFMMRPTTPLQMHIEFHYPDRRRRDVDNALSSCKHYIDGVFLALGADDSLVESTHLRRYYKSSLNGVKIYLKECKE